MPTVKAVESRIRNMEGFAVAVYWHHGGDVRGDKESFPTYPYQQAASGSSTVAEWKRTRFEPNYPGFDVEVLDPTGTSVSGNLKLDNLRGSTPGSVRDSLQTATTRSRSICTSGR
jgi:hypothetical protein